MTFARQGVDNSKMILETILGKIKLYEKGQDKKWAELIEVKIHRRRHLTIFFLSTEYWQPVLRRQWR